MSTNQVGKMTYNELRAFVEAVIDERFGTGRRQSYQQKSDRPLPEILAEMRELLIIPDPDMPSVVDMLREDRNR